MNTRFLLSWSLAGAFGLGFGFLAALAPDILEAAKTGIANPPGSSVSEFITTLVGWLVAGTILGVAQAAVLRSLSVPMTHWIFATVAGFGLAGVAIDWPLQAVGALGRIPGPVEPIIFTHGGAFSQDCSNTLRRKKVSAGKWLGFWIAGLVVSLVPTAINVWWFVK